MRETYNRRMFSKNLRKPSRAEITWFAFTGFFFVANLSSLRFLPLVIFCRCCCYSMFMLCDKSASFKCEILVKCLMSSRRWKVVWYNRHEILVVLFLILRNNNTTPYDEDKVCLFGTALGSASNTIKKKKTHTYNVNETSFLSVKCRWENEMWFLRFIDKKFQVTF